MERGPIDPRYVVELEAKLVRYRTALLRLRNLAHQSYRVKRPDVLLLTLDVLGEDVAVHQADGVDVLSYLAELRKDDSDKDSDR